jgi:hypothetical protein
MPYSQKTKPYDHQKALLRDTMDLASYALFWEMGVAKTKPVIDTIGHLFESGEINGALVLAPKAVAPNWTNDEIPDHFGVEPGRYRVFLWDTSKANGKGYQERLAEFLATPADMLAILVMSYDAIMTERKKGTARGVLKGKEAAKKLLVDRRCMFVLDESARIKGPDTKRTKRVMAAGKHAPFRRIMTGTPVPNSPFDVYTQLKFLDPDVWKKMGCGTFAAFKAMFGVWIEHERKDNGQRFKQLVDYQNLAILNKVVDRMGERLLKDDVLDLPPKLYDKRTFNMSPEQKRLYDELKREFIIWLDNGDMITAPLAITRMLRLQQVTSGYCPTDDGATLRLTPNARLTCLMDLLEDVPHQAIIWAKFQDDIDQISEAIGSDSCVVYDGRVSQTDRETRRAAFKAGDVQYFVANPAAAGEGLTLHMAKTVVYYNSTYKLGDRLQSEDRAHRAGMDDKPVNYIDLVAIGTIDLAILRALRMKVDLAAQVTGDKLREWI